MARHNINFNKLKTSLLALLNLHSGKDLSGLVRLDVDKLKNDKLPRISITLSFLSKEFFMTRPIYQQGFYKNMKPCILSELKSFVTMKHKYFSTIEFLDKRIKDNGICIHNYSISLEEAKLALEEGKLANALLCLKKE